MIFASFLFGSLTACTMFGTSKVPFPSRRVGAAPLMGGSVESSVVVPEWGEDRACVTSGDADIASSLSLSPI